MPKKIINVVVIAFFILNYTASFAQNKFSVSIHFPKELTSQKVELSYDNGRIVKKVPFLLHQNTITISDIFYFNRAIIMIQIDSNYLSLPAYSSFFVGKKPATITFNVGKNTTVNPEPYNLVNAFDIMKMADAVEKYTAPEMEAFEAFQKDTTANDSSYLINQRLVRNWVNKKLEFIRQHKNEYFSFRLFRKEVAPNFFMDPDSLLHFYKTNFPVSLRSSTEGKEIMEVLYGRKLASSENMQAPNFKVSDIDGNKIELKDCKGKYVLINFWASWCVPCVGELPAIKKISDQYFPEKLVIITNTNDNDSSAFLKAVKKYGMTAWANVYRDFDFTKKFGGSGAIPQLFLIDPNGKIIYNRSFKEDDNEKLSRLNKILKERLQ
ncbi:MAG: TlpA disulfide reductase family protein [Ferruginibacter sp.]